MPCTTGKSRRDTEVTSSEPTPSRPNAVSTTAVPTNRLATSTPTTVSSGASALRTTCRRITAAVPTPRLRAAATCSRPSCSANAAFPTRARTPNAAIAMATAGSVRCHSRSAGPVPAPVAGNQPRPIEKSASSAIDATNVGVAVAAAARTGAIRSAAPPRTADTSATAVPSAAASAAEYRMSRPDTPSRPVISDMTLVW
ncbi:hypothetical protein GCM10009678_60420 [Actinomadura kijaniata]